MGALVLALLALAFAVVLVLALLALASALVLALALLALVFALAAGVIGAGDASPLGESALAARRPLRSAFRQGMSVKCSRCGVCFCQCAQTVKIYHGCMWECVSGERKSALALHTCAGAWR